MRLYIRAFDQPLGDDGGYLWVTWLDDQPPERGPDGEMLPTFTSLHIGSFPSWTTAFVMGASALRIKNLQTR